MFGIGKKKEALLKVAEELEHARATLAGDDLPAARRAQDALRSAWSEAGADRAPALDMRRQLDQHIAELTRRNIMRQAHPCTRCGGVELSVSEAFRFTELDIPGSWARSPRMRMW